MTRATPQPARPTNLLAVLGLTLLALALCGCRFFGSGAKLGGRNMVDFHFTKGFNDDSPVPVDILVVYDEGLLTELLALEARQWFEKREDYAKSQPPGKLEINGWQWAPGPTAPPPQEYRFQVGALAAVIFAGYKAPGTHREIVSYNRHLEIRLLADHFEVRTQR